MDKPVRKQVADLVIELHAALDPDIPLILREAERPKDEIVHDLVAIGEDALPSIVASVELSKPPVQVALFDVLGELGGWPAMLCLMRFVFDHKTEIASENERAFAMKNLAKLAQPQYLKQLASFLRDITDDRDRYVQAYRLEIAGKIGDKSFEHILQNCANGDDNLIKEKARQALRVLDIDFVEKPKYNDTLEVFFGIE